MGVEQGLARVDPYLYLPGHAPTPTSLFLKSRSCVCPWKVGSGTWCLGGKGFRVVLVFLAEGSYSHPCLLTQGLSAQRCVVGVKAHPPRCNQQ